MNKYIISLRVGEQFNAAGKARLDAEAIALRMGYTPFVFEGARTAERSFIGAFRLALAGFSNWRRLIREAEAGSLVLIQYPHYPVKSAYLAKRMMPKARREKGLRFIALIHDLDSLRGLHGSGAVYGDRQVLPEFDAIICHNGKMKEYLAGQGIPEGKLIELGLFDYLTEAEPGAHCREDGVTVAGNLSPEKCGYVREWIREAGKGLRIHLYGKGLEGTEVPGNVRMHGSMAPEELPGVMEGGFGIVWDGPEAGTCAGAAGEYLKYNNPHKVSLYLVSGMPVAIWEKAALAGLVREQGFGITVGSLKEVQEKVEGVSEEEYSRMRERIEAFRRRLQGDMLEEALRKAEALWE